jgi:hypothetical protein
VANFLTDQQVANTAAAGGWTGNDLVTAVAIAIAESGTRNPANGRREVDSDAIGDVALQTGTWGPSVGPWQIRSLKAERGKGTTRDQDANMHPVTNAMHAHSIWAERHSFSPWSTFTNQSYRLYVSRAQAVAAGASAESAGHADPQGNAVQDAIGGVAAGAQAAVDAVKVVARAGAWLTNPGNVTRILQVVIGAGFVMVGASIISKPVTEPVIKGAVKAAGLVK